MIENRKVMGKGGVRSILEWVKGLLQHGGQINLHCALMLYVQFDTQSSLEYLWSSRSHLEPNKSMEKAELLLY